jgi:hypothetical protein
MKNKLKVNFADFWATFNKKENYFLKVLSEKYEVEISEDPDILFYSCYGWNYLKYKCVRIYYTAENKKTDFSACDFSISFEFLERRNHYRLPFYAYHILKDNLLEKINKPITEDEASAIWRTKNKFCCMVVSNSNAKKRLEFFHKLSEFKNVDSGGLTLNNVNGRVKNKNEFSEKYKFILAFENESFPGYLTEKIVDAFLVNAIPIYWGDPFVSNEFNKERFLNYEDYNSEEELINRILQIERNEDMFIKKLSSPLFKNNQIPSVLNEIHFQEFLWECVVQSQQIKPVATTPKRYLHFARILKYKSGKKFEFIKKRLERRKTT